MTSRSESPLESTITLDALGASGSAKGRTEADADTRASRVRRSQRVSKREGSRLLLRKNVVGEEGMLSSSSEDEAGLLRAGMAGFDGGGGGGAIGRGGHGGPGSSDAGSGEDSDGFWAPEGRVEMTQEYRCRCGGTLKGSSARSGGDGRRADAGISGQWVQCHSDACGVWEHAACCDHEGCSSSLPTETTAATIPRAMKRRHWCLPCDPKGKKHARWEEKRRKKLRQRRLAEEATVPGGAGAAGAARGATTKKKKSEAEERFGAFLEALWGAVFCGNASLLEDTFRELDERSNEKGISVEKMLQAGQLPPSGCLEVPSFRLGGGGTGGCASSEVAADADDDLHAPAVCFPLPAGLSLLMLAAGFWKGLVEEAAITAGTIFSSTAPVGLVGISSAAESGSAANVKEEPRETAKEALKNTDEPADAPAPLLAPVDLILEAKNETTTASSGLTDPGKTRGCPHTAAAAAATATIQVKTEVTRGAAAGATTEGAPVSGVAAPTTNKVAFPQLGSEGRLKVLRLILERGAEGAVLAADGEGRTALHHAAAVNGAGESTVLLGVEGLSEKAALAMVRKRVEV